MFEIAVVHIGSPGDRRVRARVAPIAVSLGASVHLAAVWAYRSEVLFEPDVERRRVTELMSASLDAWRTEHPVLTTRVSLELGRLEPVIRRLAASSQLVALPWESFVQLSDRDLFIEGDVACPLLVA